MKLLNFSILLSLMLMVLSSCIFSEKRVQIDDETTSMGTTFADRGIMQLGDSITVDTVIGDFRLYYKITEVVDTTLATFSCDEVSSTTEQYTVDKVILLNIQKLDTTSVISYQKIGIEDFASVLQMKKEDHYYIDIFHLKEVTRKAVVFSAKICMFGKNICKDVDIAIAENGTINYTLNKQ